MKPCPEMLALLAMTVIGVRCPWRHARTKLIRNRLARTGLITPGGRPTAKGMAALEEYWGRR